MVTMVDPARYRDRAQAGALLAEQLSQYAGRGDVIVLALPRGGVPVGAAVAAALGVPLDVFLVRKLGVPGHEELAMGALASGGATLVNVEVLETLGIPEQVVAEVAERERAELARREALYRDGRPFPRLTGETVLLVDDGLATGASMLVAIAALRAENPRRIVVAVPVAAPEICALVGRAADAIVCPRTPEQFEGVGKWYDDFTQVTDEEVTALLSAASAG
jgi:predicted phosphoribosyltransferase